MSHRKIVMEIVSAFDNNDIEAILSCVTDDIEWHMLGDQTVSGKENLRQFFTDHADMKMVSSTKNHIIIEGDSVSIDGDVHCSDGKTKDFHFHYCDIYDIENEKIKRITTYTVNKK